MASVDEQAKPPEPADGGTRRSFLERFIGVSLVVLASSYAGAVLAFLAPARKSAKDTEGPVDAGPLDDFPVGSAKVVQDGGGPILVVRTDDAVLAFSATCTHLGCIVQWDAERNQIHCPCHAAVFDLNGNVVSGPPPRALPIMSVAVRDGQILVGEA